MSTARRWWVLGLRGAAPAAALLPIALALAYVLDNGVITPTYDEWPVTVPVIVQAVDGTMPLSELFRLSNVHVHLLPQTVSVVLALLTGYDSRWELAFSFATLLAACGLTLALWRRAGLTTLHGWSWVILIALVFDMTQFINFILPFQKVSWFVVLGVYASADVVQRWGPTRTGWLVGGIVASATAWSFLGGHLLWLLIPAAMGLAGGRGWRPFARWFVWMLINLIPYVLIILPELRKEANTLGEAEPLSFLLTFLGGPFSGSLDPAAPYAATDVTQAALVGGLGIGLFGLSLYAVLRDRGRRQRTAPWLLLIAFSVGSAALVLVGRGATVLLATNSRFTTLAIPFWIGLFGLTVIAAGVAPDGRWLRRLAGPLLLILAALYLASAARFAGHDFPRDRLAQCVLTLDAPDCLERFSGLGIPRPRDREIELLALVDALRTRRLSVFGRAVFPGLEHAALRHPVGEPAPSWQTWRIDDAVRRVLFMPAAGSVELRVFVPDAASTVRLDSAIYLPHPQLIPGDADRLLADGASFSLVVIDEAGAEQTAYSASFDPFTQSDPSPFTVDLTPYRGQIITLRFAIESHANPDYDWAMWVEPRLTGS